MGWKIHYLNKPIVNNTFNKFVLITIIAKSIRYFPVNRRKVKISTKEKNCNVDLIQQYHLHG